MSEQKLSAAEAELYDRQIRLWGIESQEKLRAANVLLIGISSLGSEIAKNILLSGINSLLILDDGIVTEEEQQKNFLLNKNSVGKHIANEVLAKAQDLNPLVKLTADTSAPTSKPDSFFQNFTIIIATRIKVEFILKLDKICRANNIKLIFGDVVGVFGYLVSDFQKHEYYEDQLMLSGKKRKRDGSETKAEKHTVKVKGEISYPDMNQILILPNNKTTVESLKKVKRNDYFFLMMIVLEFRTRQGRDPEVKNKENDIGLLKDIKAHVLKLFQVDREILNDDVLDLLFDEVVPTCAVLGGVIAQEAIKAVSQKEVPINNLFLFDPITYCGKEERIGG